MTIKNISSIVGLILFLLASSFSAHAFHNSICNRGPQTIVGTLIITQSCTVTGDLTIGTNARLIVDYSRSSQNVFTMQGNIRLQSNGVFQIDGGTLNIQQDQNRHREITSIGNSSLIIRNAEVITNQGIGNKYMLYIGRDNSKMTVANSSLDKNSSWLISNFFDDSQLTTQNMENLPTEVYIKGASTVQLNDSRTGMHVNLLDGITGTIDLPVQVNGDYEEIPYTWSIGRDVPGLSGVEWQLDINNSVVGIGVESLSGSSVTINGVGAPPNGELTVSYHVQGGTETLTGLHSGLQFLTLGNGQLTLNNVNLGKVAWQIYAHQNEMLTINDSVINEVGAALHGHITVNRTLLQLAGATALGNGSSVEINDSQVHSQTIEAFIDGEVTLNNSAVYGGVIVTHEPTSKVHFEGGAFLPNPGSVACTLDIALTETGAVVCNPFLPDGAEVTKMGPGSVTCSSTFNCNW